MQVFTVKFNFPVCWKFAQEIHGECCPVVECRQFQAASLNIYPSLGQEHLLGLICGWALFFPELGAGGRRLPLPNLTLNCPNELITAPSSLVSGV